MNRKDAAAKVDELDVAIIGMSGRFPGSPNVDRYWEHLRAGDELTRKLDEATLLRAGADPKTIRQPNYVNIASTLDDIEQFDPAFFGYSPKEAATMDPQGRLLMEAAWLALEDAGYDPFRAKVPIGMFATGAMPTYPLRNTSSRFNHSEFILSGQNIHQVIGNCLDFMATRISYRLDLRGPAMDVQTACSSSLVALHLARQSLLNEECDMALAGGVSIYLPQELGYQYEEGLMLSPDGQCRPFDSKANGTIFGRGVGAVLLKPLQRAIADGDRVLAVLKGSAINNDGIKKVGFTAPSVDGQASVIAEALAVAGLDPEQISYIEAHGTGTKTGDPIEFAGLRRVFAGHGAPHSCGVGSVKSNMGHLDVAAGMASLIKVIQMMRYREIPESLHFDQPNPEIDLDGTPFYFSDSLHAWEPSEGPRRAGISAFGFGGTNAHVLLEEAPRLNLEAPKASRKAHVLFLSAKNASALEQSAANWSQHLEGADGGCRL